MKMWNKIRSCFVPVTHMVFIYIIAGALILATVVSKSTAERNTVIGKVTCQVISLNVEDNELVLNLKCGDKDYKTTDMKLIKAYISESGKPIHGALYPGDKVRAE